MRIIQKDTAALMVDIQERLLPAVDCAEQTLDSAIRLIKGLDILQIPLIPIRQYPQGLGDFPPELWEVLKGLQPLDKTTFSAWEEPKIAEKIRSLDKKNLLVFGMEAHVCVQQTVIDLLSEGFSVVVIVDCITSRCFHDKKIALRRLEQEGALLATSESILFELLRKSGTETFKKISTLVK
ncbi:MAG: isochorismatase family protein [Bacillota bacterium]